MNQMMHHQGQALMQQQAQQNEAVISSEHELQMMLFNPQAMSQLMALAHEMAQATVTVPKHLQGKQGDCLAVVMQAAQWRMNPFAVAQKTHLVNGTLGYEAQLVNAVVQNSGAIVGSFTYEYSGQGEQLACRVGAQLKHTNHITWGEWLPIGLVTTRNSPLWKTNPKQQLGYLQVKNWARAYCPGAILGVYSVDELQDYEGQIKDVTPAPARQHAQPAPALDTSPITPEQCQQLLKEAAFVGKDEAYICATARIEQITDLAAHRFEPCLNHLRSLAQAVEQQQHEQQPMQEAHNADFSV